MSAGGDKGFGSQPTTTSVRVMLGSPPRLPCGFALAGSGGGGGILGVVTPLVETVARRLAEREPRRAPRRLRAAAVLVPILAEADAPGEAEHIVLTRRSETLRRQPGDIAFPGGAVEPGDPSVLDAALRESAEEVGLDPGDVTVLGQLDERETINGFHLTPFVGWVRGPYRFETNHEVGELLRVPVSALREEERLVVEQRRLPDGSMRDVYHYYYEGHDIWGITGQILRELLEML